MFRVEQGRRGEGGVYQFVRIGLCNPISVFLKLLYLTVPALKIDLFQTHCVRLSTAVYIKYILYKYNKYINCNVWVCGSLSEN